MPDTTYDVAIIGAGPGGYTAAIRAGQLGLKVCLIEKDARLGGTCLQVGCIPTKALLFNAEVYDHLKAAQEYGIDGVTSPKLNWKVIQDRKDKIVTKHTKGLDFLMRKNKVVVVHGYGRLTGPAKNGIHTIDVTDDGKSSQIQTKNIILASGSFARMLPGLQADSNVLTNIEVLSLSAIPKSMIIIGSGAVGVEFASIYKSFGVEVTVIEMLPRLVPVEDEEVSKELLRSFKKRGINCFVNTKVDKVEKTKSGMAVSFTPQGESQQRLEAEKVLVAIGRGPNTEKVGLDKTPKIKTERGYVHVNEWMETGEKGIYAVGDIVAGLPQLAHVASMCGIVAVTRIAGKPAKPVNKNHIPGCTYCEPQIGSVGLTEAKAKEAGYQVKIGKFPFTANSKASIMNHHEGFIKVVSDTKFGEILGVHIIGPVATEIIAEAVTALELEGTVEDLMFTVHAHPTVAEGLLDAFSAVEGEAINF
ncbi:MAG: dihydrolipoyl dehydrogenase [Candidatus Angelobacter sp. Gp1-AA117]|nr:MAG: dihydrolipoyl dehydrogenase [Candidatus Angelobacter sp. Gp1-AA117]